MKMNKTLVVLCVLLTVGCATVTTQAQKYYNSLSNFIAATHTDNRMLRKRIAKNVNIVAKAIAVQCSVLGRTECPEVNEVIKTYYAVNNMSQMVTSSLNDLESIINGAYDKDKADKLLRKIIKIIGTIRELDKMMAGAAKQVAGDNKKI